MTLEEFNTITSVETIDGVQKLKGVWSIALGDTTTIFMDRHEVVKLDDINDILYLKDISPSYVDGYMPTPIEGEELKSMVVAIPLDYIGGIHLSLTEAEISAI